MPPKVLKYLRYPRWIQNYLTYAPIFFAATNLLNYPARPSFPRTKYRSLNLAVATRDPTIANFYMYNATYFFIFPTLTNCSATTQFNAFNAIKYTTS